MLAEVGVVVVVPVQVFVVLAVVTVVVTVLVALAAGGGSGRPEVLTKKPRKPRRRKEVTADKFIVLRVTEELYQQVQSASELAGTDTSKWVRQAVVEQLGK